MKIDKKLMSLAEQVLSQVDNLGFQLDALGVENQINRHNLIAMAMFGQKRIEGEVDSWTAKVETKVAKVEALADTFSRYVKSGVNVVTYPATFTLGLINRESSEA